MKKTRTLKISKSKSVWGKRGGDGGVKEFLLVVLLLSVDAVRFIFSFWPLELAQVHLGSQISFSRDSNLYSMKLQPTGFFYPEFLCMSHHLVPHRIWSRHACLNSILVPLKLAGIHFFKAENTSWWWALQAAKEGGIRGTKNLNHFHLLNPRFLLFITSLLIRSLHSYAILVLAENLLWGN